MEGLDHTSRATAWHVPQVNEDSIRPWLAPPTTMHADLNEQVGREEEPASDTPRQQQRVFSARRLALHWCTSPSARTPETTSSVEAHQTSNEGGYGNPCKRDRRPEVPSDTVLSSLLRAFASSWDSGRHTSRTAVAARWREMLRDPLHCALLGYTRCTNPLPTASRFGVACCGV
jgi:hypothetical protein